MFFLRWLWHNPALLIWEGIVAATLAPAYVLIVAEGFRTFAEFFALRLYRIFPMLLDFEGPDKWDAAMVFALLLGGCTAYSYIKLVQYNLLIAYRESVEWAQEPNQLFWRYIGVAVSICDALLFLAGCVESNMSFL